MINRLINLIFKTEYVVKSICKIQGPDHFTTETNQHKIFLLDAYEMLSDPLELELQALCELPNEGPGN